MVELEKENFKMCEMCDTYDRHIAVVKKVADGDPEHREDLLELAAFLKRERDGSMEGPNDPVDPRVGPLTEAKP